MEAPGRYLLKNGNHNRARKIHTYFQTDKDKFDKAFSFPSFFFSFFSAWMHPVVLCCKRTKEKKDFSHDFMSSPRPLWICMNWRKQRSCRLCFVQISRSAGDGNKGLENVVCFLAADAFLLGVPINIHVSRSLLSQRKKKKTLLKKIPNNITLIDFRFSSSRAVPPI